MADYIERQAALDLVESAGAWGWSKNQLYEEIQAVPAANVREDVQGEWVLKHVGAGHYWECSACHENPCIYVTKNTNFCPHCGARMAGGGER